MASTISPEIVVRVEALSTSGEVLLERSARTVLSPGLHLTLPILLDGGCSYVTCADPEQTCVEASVGCQSRWIEPPSP